MPAHVLPARPIVLAAFMLLAASGCSSGRQKFATPEQAAQSLVAAMRSGSDAALKDVLGADADELFNSGDAVQDRNDAERFVKSYDQKHELIPADGSLTLCIGPNQWPFPIPLVKDKAAGWKFDTERGRDEILNRRIGRNELSAIKVCQAIVDAQQDYVRRSVRAGGPPVYAAKFLSNPGQYDGLSWDTRPDEPPSPLGVLIANAVEEGYQPGHQLPYHGYYYRLMFKQGPHADGGAMDYLVDGKLLAGFAVIARPVEYGSSGIMTFIVNYQGTVLQRNLGPDTVDLAKRIDAYDPGPEWTKAE